MARCKDCGGFPESYGLIGGRCTKCHNAQAAARIMATRDEARMCDKVGCGKAALPDKYIRVMGVWQAFCKEHHREMTVDGGWTEQDSWDHAVELLDRPLAAS